MHFLPVGEEELKRLRPDQLHGEGEKLRLTYSHPAVLGDIQFAWESSADLSSWQPATPTKETVEGIGFWRTRTSEFPIEPLRQRFFRITVQQTP